GADHAGAARRTGRNIDDAAPAALAHAANDRLGAQERGLEIDRDGAIEVRLAQVVDAAAERDAGIVDQHVDRPELRGHGSHHRVPPGPSGPSARTATAVPPVARIAAATASASATRLT